MKRLVGVLMLLVFYSVTIFAWVSSSYELAGKYGLRPLDIDSYTWSYENFYKFLPIFSNQLIHVITSMILIISTMIILAAIVAFACYLIFSGKKSVESTT